jgi:hypothetical protein
MLMHKIKIEKQASTLVARSQGPQPIEKPLEKEAL